MKKYLLSFFGMMLVLVMSSCSNEDVPYAEKVTFKVNPATVVSSYIEFNAGELSSLGSDNTLHVRLYIYDEDGNLVQNAEESMSDYTHVMNASFNLPVGNYKAVAITDITSLDNAGDELKYWEISGEQKLNTLTVQDAGYIGGSSKILGLSVVNINVDEYSNNFSIDVRPGGALAIVHFRNWNRYSDVKSFTLDANRSCDMMNLDANGNAVYSVESSSNLDWYLAMHNYNSEYVGGYNYVFLFPMQNVTMQFGAILDNNKNYFFPGARSVVDIEMGREYYFAYDIQSEEAIWNVYTNVYAKSAAREYAGKEKYENNGFVNKQSMRIADVPVENYIK